MANKSGGNTLYFIIGAVVVAVIAVAFFMFQESNEPDLAIDIGDDGLTVETN